MKRKNPNSNTKSSNSRRYIDLMGKVCEERGKRRERVGWWNEVQLVKLIVQMGGWMQGTGDYVRQNVL